MDLKQRMKHIRSMCLYIGVP